MTVYVKTPNKGTVNMRAEPNSSARVLTRIPYQTKLDATIVDSTWYQVSYNGNTGYVMSEFLTSDSTNNLQEIYDSLKATLALIEKALK